MKQQYKLELFLPLAVIVILVSILAVITSYYVQKDAIKEQKLSTISIYNERFDKLVESDTNILHSLVKLMMKDKELENTFLQNDREVLYRYIEDSYKTLNHFNNITHLYFIKPNGKVLLRGHDLKRHSDIIERYTFIKAKKTQLPSYGLEYGIKKNYTLRMVYPWIVDGKLIGYIELGKEVDKLMDELSSQLSIDIHLAIHKDIYKDMGLDIKKRLRGMKEFGDHYLAYSTAKIPPNIKDLLRNKKETLWIRMNNKEYISYTTNLYDVSKTNLGHKVFIIDISHEYNALITNIKQYGLIMIFGTIMMLFLGYRLEKFKQKKIDDTLETLENSQKKLEQAKKKAEEANNAKSDFLANMSHEIRTPMNAILGFIQLLQKHETDNEKLKKLNIIQSSGNSLLAVINDILDFSKIERGKLDVEKQNFELKKPFEESTTLLFEKASEKGINTQLYFDAQLPKFAIGDALRIKQVVSNLLNNAIKFTDSKGSISVKVDYDTSKKLIICTVEDNGIGISKDKIEYIFTSFSQADTSTTRKYGGTGLGLTISSQLIKLMGGELRVESIIGEGSSFIFSLPLFDEIELLENNEDVIDEEKMEENDAETIFEGAVLLVEDNRANQMLMGIFLDEFGLEYTIASDGIEAISTFKNNKFNIILMDENMPNMNGLEATKKIIAYEKEHNLIHTPIIAVTANALTGDRDYFTKDGGMDDYLAKPIDHKDLERILGIYLKRV